MKRLSIAVLVDQGAKWEGQGKQMHRVAIPPDPEKLKAIQTLVGTLVGLTPERGDQLTVEALPFDTSLNIETPSENAPSPQKTADPPLSLDALKKKPAVLYGSAAGVALLLLVAFLAFGRRKGRRDVQVQAALPASPQGAVAGGVTAGVVQPPASMPALLPSKSEMLLNQLQESGKKDPEAWAGVVRGWLAEEGS